MLAPIWCHATGAEVLGDGFDRSPDFWLRDGGSACRFHSVIWTGYGLQPHNRWSGNGIGGVTVPLGAVDVTKLAMINLMIIEHGFQVSAA
jgi:hypothetical protein